MDTKLLKSISSQVYQRFPELKDCQPKVQPQSVPQAKSTSAVPTYLIIYRGSASAPDGRSISRIVRVVANTNGKILKITTSR
jgi:hypothetical protein